MILTSPLEQFQVFPILPVYLWDFNFSLTNSSLVLFLGGFGFFLLLYSLLSKEVCCSFVPERWQTIVETFYEVIAGLVIKDIIGVKGQGFFPFLFSLFCFISLSNLMGLVPYSFTPTSQIIVTFSLALFLFLGINIICARLHKFSFFSLFLPPGSSLTLAFVLIPIELVSYFVRPISLSVRLFANMMAGHTLLKVVAGFSWNMMPFETKGLFIVHFLPLFILVAVLVLELGVAIIQAYVFTVLTTIYLNDAVNLH